MWYLAIVTTWGAQYHVYIPVNALNFVHEDATIPDFELSEEMYSFSKF